MNRLQAFLTIALLASFFQAVAAEETQWCELTGQLIYDGQPPERKKLEVRIGFPETFDESLVVDAKTHGVANVFVYLRPSKNAEPLKVHPDYAEQLKKPVQITIDERGYTPHVFLVHTNQTLMIAHRGKVAFNVKIDTHKNGPCGIVIPLDAEAPYHFPNPESIPSTLSCNIHPWVSGYFLIRDNPYMAVTDAQGRFTIKDLPVGEHEFQFWQEKVGYLKLPAIKLRDADITGKLDKGRMLVPIERGENDLGEIKLDPKQFK